MPERHIVSPDLRIALGRVFSAPGLRTIGRIPYSVALRVAEVYLKSTTRFVDVWPRHSYVSGTLTPFLSDLDLSVWLQTTPSSTEALRLRKSLRLLSTAVPVISEVNVYVESEASLFLPFGNIFELNRDPVLIERARPACNRSPLWAQAVVFILRQMDADSNTLLTAPETRRLKWKQHLRVFSALLPDSEPIANFDLRGLSLESLAGLALKIAGLETDPGRARELVSYFLDRRNVPKPVSSLLWSFLPHRLCWQSGPPGLSETELSVALAQLDWEIWGLWTQCRHHELSHTFPAHIERLQDAIRTLAAHHSSVALQARSEAFKALFRVLPYA